MPSHLIEQSELFYADLWPFIYIYIYRYTRNMLTGQSFYQYSEPSGGLGLSKQNTAGRRRCVFPSV